GEGGHTIDVEAHAEREWRGFEALVAAALAARQAVFDPVEPPAAPPEFATGVFRIALPLTQGERIVAVVGLGGRRGGYDETLLGQVRLLLQAGATVIAARQAELELRDRNALLQQTWERQLLLLNTVPHGVGEVDVGGTVIQANAALHRVLGYDEGELVGRRVWERRGGDEPSEFLSVCHELLMRERPEPGLLFFRERARDGRVLDLRLDWDYRLDQGASCGLVVVVTDMTDRRRAETAFQEVQGHLERRAEERTALLTREIGQRKQAEQLLRESEEHYRLLAENSTDMISQQDAAAVYQYVSPSCRALLGYEPDELLGRDPYDLYHPDDVAAVRATHEQILRGPGVA